MATENNAINYGGLTVKASPVIGDSVAIIDSSSSNEMRMATIGSLPNGIPTSIYPDYISGKYYPSGVFVNPNYSLTNVSQSILVLNFSPFFVPKTGIFTKIAVGVQTGSAATNCNMGIYNSAAGNNQPTGTPIANSESGNVATTSSAAEANYTFASPITLTAGVYWLAFAQSSALVTMYAVQSNSTCLGVSAFTAPYTVTNVGQWTQVYAFGALPTVGTLTGHPPGTNISPFLVAQ